MVNWRFTRELIAINHRFSAIAVQNWRRKIGGSASYQIWFKLPVPNHKPNLNPKTDPNPNSLSNNNEWSTKQHRNKVQHSVIYVIFVGQGVGIAEAYNRRNHPRWRLVNRGDHRRSKRDPRAKHGFFSSSVTYPAMGMGPLLLGGVST